MINQMGSGFRHSSGATRQAKASSFAGECNELVVDTVSTPQAQESMGQNAAFKKGIKFVLDELRKTATRCSFNLGKECGSMVLHEVIKSARFRAVALVMDARAVMRLEWLWTEGLQVRLQRADLSSIP